MPEYRYVLSLQRNILTSFLSFDRCIPGYTEALFSAKCIKETDCKDQWIIVLVIFLAFAYSTFLLYQKNVKDFIFGAPLGKNKMKYYLKKNKKTKPNDDAVFVYKLLQGPYREFDLPGILRYTCWSGVLLGRRLCLILAATFISNVVVRLSIMI